MMVRNIGGQNAKLHFLSKNQAAADKNENKAGKKQEENRVIAFISPAAKKQSMLQQLMKQKQDLTERMNSLSTSSRDGNSSIQEQMKELQKQMEALDVEIMKLHTQVEDKKKEDKKTSIYEKPMTKEQAEKKKLNDMMSLATSTDQMDVISSAKGQMDRKVSVLKAEIETGYGDIDSKMEEVANLQSKSASLGSQLAQKITEINEGVDGIRDDSKVTDSTKSEDEDKDSSNITAQVEDIQKGTSQITDEMSSETTEN